MFRPSTSRRRVGLLSVAASLVLLVAACGEASDEGSAEVASLESDTPQLENAADAATLSDAEAAEDLAPDEAALEFSQCMRDQGLDFPDLSVNAEGEIELRETFQSIDRSDDSFRDAFQSCSEVLEQTGFGGGRRAALESTEVQDALLEFSACVRAEGFDVGDLTLQPPGGAGGGGAGGNANAGENAQGDGQPPQRQQGFGDPNARYAEGLGLDYEDPAVVEAIDGCSTIIDEAFAAAGIAGRN